MDVALELLDPLVFDKAYAWALPHPGASLSNSSDVNNLLAADAAPMSLWDRDNIYRQCISILLITQFGASALYFFFRRPTRSQLRCGSTLNVSIVF